MKRSVELAWSDRWWALLGVAAQDALAASLLNPLGKKLVLDDRNPTEPELADLLDGQRWASEHSAPLAFGQLVQAAAFWRRWQV